MVLMKIFIFLSRKKSSEDKTCNWGGHSSCCEGDCPVRFAYKIVQCISALKLVNNCNIVHFYLQNCDAYIAKLDHRGQLLYIWLYSPSKSSEDTQGVQFLFWISTSNCLRKRGTGSMLLSREASKDKGIPREENSGSIWRCEIHWGSQKGGRRIHDWQFGDANICCSRWCIWSNVVFETIETSSIIISFSSSSVIRSCVFSDLTVVVCYLPFLLG